MSSMEFVNLVLIVAMLAGVAAWVITTERSARNKDKASDRTDGPEPPFTGGRLPLGMRPHGLPYETETIRRMELKGRVILVVLVVITLVVIVIRVTMWLTNI